MGGVELGVDEPNATLAAFAGESEQGDFGGVPGSAEHGLAQNMPPKLTPYSPPTSSPSFKTSTEWASPAACRAA